MAAEIAICAAARWVVSTFAKACAIQLALLLDVTFKERRYT